MKISRSAVPPVWEPLTVTFESPIEAAIIVVLLGPVANATIINDIMERYPQMNRKDVEAEFKSGPRSDKPYDLYKALDGAIKAHLGKGA